MVVPYFMREIVEQISIEARKSRYVDQQSGVSARLRVANYRIMIASARRHGQLTYQIPDIEPELDSQGEDPADRDGPEQQ